MVVADLYGAHTGSQKGPRGEGTVLGGADDSQNPGSRGTGGMPVRNTGDWQEPHAMAQFADSSGGSHVRLFFVVV